MTALTNLVAILRAATVLCVGVCEGSAESRHFGNNAKDTRKVCSGTTEVGRSIVSTIECAEECSRDGSCDAYGYKKSAKLCHKYTIDSNNPGKMESAKGWIYFEKMPKGRDCSELYKAGTRQSGVYSITPSDDLGQMKVYCDMVTDGGGWTVFQRRQGGSQDFFIGWNDYKNGFGNLKMEFWLGNGNIHRLTHQAEYELRVDLEDHEGNNVHASYSLFSVASETFNYKLTIAGYSGDAGDSMSYHNGQPFSTKDRDNDDWDDQCANKRNGAWWYTYNNKTCAYSNLNGEYGNNIRGQGVLWDQFKGSSYSLKRTGMMIRPVGFTST